MLKCAAQLLSGLVILVAALSGSAQAGLFAELEDRDDIARLEPVPSGNPKYELVRIRYWSEEAPAACPGHYPAAYRPRLADCPVAKVPDDPLPGYMLCGAFYASNEVGCPGADDAAIPIGYVTCSYAFVADFAREDQVCPDESAPAPPLPGLVACASRDKASGPVVYFYAREDDGCAPGGGEVIYGEDDRTLAADAAPAEREAARSVAVIIPRSLLWTVDGSLTPERAGRMMALCPSERFAKFPAPGFCTAFKVGDRFVVTAGHCIRTSDQCAKSSFAFEFERSAAQEGGSPLPPIPAERIYHCIRVIDAEQPGEFLGKGPDWSIVEVDRKIDHVPTVELARTEKKGIPRGASVTVIGHPSGLPKIVTPGGRIERALDSNFMIDSDTYRGNSGSPVFLTDSIGSGRPVVVGVLVRGEGDFKKSREAGSLCYSSRRCGEVGDPGCGGEGATYTGRFFDKVQATNAASAVEPR